MKGFRGGEIPIPVRYDSESSSISLASLLAYTARMICAMARRPPWRRKPFGSAALAPLFPEGRADA